MCLEQMLVISGAGLVGPIAQVRTDKHLVLVLAHKGTAEATPKVHLHCGLCRHVSLKGAWQVDAIYYVNLGCLHLKVLQRLLAVKPLPCPDSLQC